MRGFSGVHWIIANLFVICSIFCLQSYAAVLLNQREAEPPDIHSQAEPGNEFNKAGNESVGAVPPCPLQPSHLQNKWVIGSIIFGILGCISYSTPLALWPILCAAAIVLRFPTASYLLIFCCFNCGDWYLFFNL